MFVIGFILGAIIGFGGTIAYLFFNTYPRGPYE